MNPAKARKLVNARKHEGQFTQSGVSGRRAKGLLSSAASTQAASWLEMLEPRLMLSSTLFVTTASDGGDGSLRQAIIEANASPGHDVIDFNIGNGLQQISLLSALPPITDELTLDGTTQAGYAGTPLIWLDGSGFTDPANGLTLVAGNSLIRGLAITGFNEDGILIQGSDERILDNFIGVDPTGAIGAGNSINGVEVSGIDNAASASADIQGNVISANEATGISFSWNFAASDVINNKIGLDASGRLALGNWGNGIYIGQSAADSSMTVRDNVISGNYGDGVCLDGAANAVVTGNRIGTDSSGVTSIDEAGGLLSNFGNGITLQNSAANNVIGGPDADALNLISGNFGDGVRILGGADNLVQGNYIGTNLSGTEAIPNGNGVAVLASGNRIIDNVLSGNYGDGVRIEADSNTIQGNLVGTEADRLSALPNGADGIWIDGSGNLIGGPEAGKGNVIAFNVGNGITVNTGTGNAIRGNSIYGNASGDPAYPGIGIDLGYNGVTLNDSMGHNGPNQYQNFPVLLNALRDGTTVTVQGTLASAPSQTFTVEFFSNEVADSSGYGQGQTFIGSAAVTTNASGLASFTVTLNRVPVGQDILTATATDAAGNTSEFVAAQIMDVSVGSSPASTATSLSASANPSIIGQSVTFTATVVDLTASGVPTGSITFMDGSTPLGTGTLNPSGQATWTTSDLGLGMHNITAVYAGENRFEPSTSDPLAQVVNRAGTTTTVSSSANPSIFGQGVTFTASVSGNGFGVGTLTGSVTFMDGTAVLGDVAITNGSASITTSTLAAGNHAITAVYGGNTYFAGSTSTALNQTVTPAVLTVTANPASKVYGAANPSFTDTITGFVNGDTSGVVSGVASLTTAATTGSPVGTYTITAGQGTLSASNYSFVYVNSTLTVTQAVLTVAANPASKVYGAANPSLTDTITGFVNGDTSGVVSGIASLTTAATTGSPVGTYTITAGQGTLSAGNYSFTYVNSTLTVNQAVLTVTANPASKVYGAANPSFTDTITGFVNGDGSGVVSGVASLTTAATTSSPVGTYTITAGQGTLSASNYSFAYVNSTLTVTPAVLTVTANPAAKVYGAANPTFTDSITGFVNGDASSVVSGIASLTTAATTGSPVGTYAVTAAQGTLSAGNYSFAYVNSTLTVTQAVLTVTANPASKVYGAVNPSFTDTITGFVNGDASGVVSGIASLTTAATTGSPVGTYTITAGQGTLSANNYSFAYVNSTLTVTPAVLTVTANPASKVYGAVNPTFTDTITGFVNGDASNVVSGVASLTTAATTGSPVGMYTITAGQGTLSASNYSFAYVNSTLTVTQAITKVTLTSSANPSACGQSVTFTANVSVVTPGSGSPIGSVNFMDGSTLLGAATLSNGMASLATSALAVGNHTITAVYGGSGNFSTSTSAPLTQAVNPSLSTLNGYVYLDTNNDGIKQSSESGISGVQVTLTGSNDLGSIAPVTAQTDATGLYAFPNLRPGTYAITETSPAGYIDGKDTLGTLGGTPGSDVFTGIVVAGGVNGSGYNFGELKNVISGHTLRDMSGNGMTDDDVALSGTTVNLYLERNGNTILDSGDGSPVATAVSDASGAYAFVNVAPGQYYTREVVPSGYVRTIPYLADYYSVNLSSTPGGTGFDFDNYKQCTGTITNVTYTINNTKTVTDLRGQTKQGDTVTVTFTVTGTAATHVTFVTYNAPSAVFDADAADEQTIDQQVGGTFNPGVHSLTVTIPNNYYQIDFVKCVAIDHFGPAGSNIFYSAQGRLISADNAGTHSDIDDMAASTAFWANLGQTLIRNFNVTDSNLAPTALGNWLAQNFPNLYGSSGANNMFGKTNADVAALFTKFYKNTAQKTDAQVLATALNVYASTTSLGGQAGTAYQFDVTDDGLGAADFNVLTNGAAFGVANNTTLSVWQILLATNSKSKNGVLYNGVASMLSMAYSLYYQINMAGGIG